VLLERIEEVIARLRAKRPDLDYLIDRATGIITTHLACRQQRVVVIRIGLGGRPKFLFRSLNELGATYVINPSVWSCTCPAYHRTGGPCKHVLSAWIMWSVARPRGKRLSCAGCAKTLPRRELVEVQHEDRSEQHFPGDHLCKTCANGGAGVAF
jgi:hypothetical protein